MLMLHEACIRVFTYFCGILCVQYHSQKINLHRGRGSERLERGRDCVLIWTPLKQDFASFFSQNISLGATKPVYFGIIFETWKFCNF
jgi:hypothetical protein